MDLEERKTATNVDIKCGESRGEYGVYDVWNSILLALLDWLYLIKGWRGDARSNGGNSSLC